MAKLSNAKSTQVIIQITGDNKKVWYEGMVGNLMKAILHRDDSRAQSKSMKDRWVEREHFKVVRGKDPRTFEKRTGIKVDD